jgi:hypothetical protein
VIGSAFCEWIMPANSTANNVAVYPVSETGCSNIPARLLTGGLIFVQRLNERVFRFQWQGLSNPWIPPEDLTDFAPHLFETNPIVSFDVQVIPDVHMWFQRTDGSVAVLMWKMNRCVAWWRFITSGTVQSVCVVPGTDAVGLADRDIVYLCVTRNGYNYVEQVASRNPFTGNLYVESDCATVSQNGAPVNRIAVDVSFNGYGLEVVADGAYLGVVYPSGGFLYLPGGVTAHNIVAGFNFVSWLQSMPLVAAPTDGSASMKVKTSPQQRIRVLNTLYVEVGMTANVANATSVNLGVTYTNPLQTPVSGAFKCPIQIGMGRDVQLSVFSNLPLPCTVTGLVPDSITTE